METTPTKITGKLDGYYPRTPSNPGQGVNPIESPFTPSKIKGKIQGYYPRADEHPGQGIEPTNLFGNDSKEGGKRRKRSRKGGKWSMKYKRSINCRKPKGFSQKQHCKYGRRSRRR